VKPTGVGGMDVGLCRNRVMSICSNAALSEKVVFWYRNVFIFIFDNEAFIFAHETFIGRTRLRPTLSPAWLSIF
jgi:hypothetical protein